MTHDDDDTSRQKLNQCGILADRLMLLRTKERLNSWQIVLKPYGLDRPYQPLFEIDFANVDKFNYNYMLYRDEKANAENTDDGVFFPSRMNISIPKRAGLIPTCNNLIWNISNDGPIPDEVYKPCSLFCIIIISNEINVVQNKKIGKTNNLYGPCAYNIATKLPRYGIDLGRISPEKFAEEYLFTHLEEYDEEKACQELARTHKLLTHLDTTSWNLIDPSGVVQWALDQIHYKTVSQQFPPGLDP